MKKIKFLIILIAIYIFSGCSAQVNLTVTTNKNILEDLKVTVDNEYISGYFNDLSEIKKNYKLLLDEYDNKYDFKVKKSGNNIVGKVSKKGKLNVGTTTGLESALFKNISEDNSNYTLVLSDEIVSYLTPDLEIDVDENALLNNITINIQFHNVVSNTNSDSYNNATNTYTWIIDKTNLDKNIEFTITNEKRYDIIIAYLLKKYIDFIILGVIAIIITIIILLIAQKSKHENEI